MIAARAQRPVRATVDIDDSNAGLSQADGRGEASRPSPPTTITSHSVAPPP